MAEKIIMKFLDFFLDIKNILSIGALYVFIDLTKSGQISPENAMIIVSMVFTFFLGSKLSTAVKTGA